MPRRVVGLILMSTACGSEAPQLAVPALETEYIVYGTAAEGRSLFPFAVQVARTEEVPAFTPTEVGGGAIDVLVAGLVPSDLPVGLPPKSLVFVQRSETNARPLPSLVRPHILEAPAPAERPGALVPVDVPPFPDVSDERRARLDVLLSDLAIQNPCLEPKNPFLVIAPRTRADGVYAMRTLSNGDTFVGLGASQVILMGRLRPGSTEIEEIEVVTGTTALVEFGERAEVSSFSRTEGLLNGVSVPREITVNLSAGFGSVGRLVVLDEAGYRDDTPATREAPRLLRGVSRMTSGGAEERCTFGGVVGSDRTAAIWCRPEAPGEPYQVRALFERAFAITAYVQTRFRNLAFDLAGTVYEELAPGEFAPRLESGVNTGCSPLCAAFTSVHTNDDRGTSVLAGAGAELLVIDDDVAGVRAERPASLSPALFRDERPGAAAPVRFSAVHRAPDGALWLATVTPDLLRISADRSRVDRICLPREMKDVPISALEAHPDGRLIVGMVPALLAFGRWEEFQ